MSRRAAFVAVGKHPNRRMHLRTPLGFYLLLAILSAAQAPLPIFRRGPSEAYVWEFFDGQCPTASPLWKFRKSSNSNWTCAHLQKRLSLKRSTPSSDPPNYELCGGYHSYARKAEVPADRFRQSPRSILLVLGPTCALPRGKRLLTKIFLEHYTKEFFPKWRQTKNDLAFLRNKRTKTGHLLPWKRLKWQTMKRRPCLSWSLHN